MQIENRKYGTLDILRLPFTTAPLPSILVGAQQLFSGLAPTIQVIATANFIDAAVAVVQDGADIHSVIPSLLAVIALLAYTWTSNALAKFSRVRMELAIRSRFRTALTEKRARLKYQYIEDSATWDLVSRVSKEPEKRLSDAFQNLTFLISLTIRVI